MERTKDGYRLGSGREIVVDNWIIGLSPDLRVTEGCACPIDEANDLHPDDDPIDHWTRLTSAERIELADFMIAQWGKYRALAINPKGTSQ